MQHSFLKFYEILQRHFNNDADAKSIVSEIEQIVDNKINERKEVLATKEDIGRIDLRISGLETLFERRFNHLIMWLAGTVWLNIAE